MSNNEVKVLITAKDEATKVLKKVSGETKKFGNESAETFDKVGNKMTLMKGAIVTGATVAGVALLAMGKQSIAMGMEFDKAMANVSTLVDTNVESMSRMKSEVLDLGSKAPVPLAELTSSLYDVRSAGIEAGDAMDVLDTSMRLGVAGLGSTKDATTLMTLAMNNFRDAGYEADDVANLMFKTVKNGITNIEQMSQSFGLVAPLAVEAGVSLEELQSATSALTQVNKSASISQNQIKASLVALSKPTAEATELFEKLGVKTFPQLIEKSGGLVEAYGAMKDASLDYGDGADEAFAKAMGSGEALSAVNALLGAQAESYQNTLADMRGGVDDLTSAYEKQTETASMQWDMIKNKLNVAMTKLGLVALNIITPALKFINSLFDENTKAGSIMSGVLGVLGSILKTVGQAFMLFVDILKFGFEVIMNSPIGWFAKQLGGLATKVLPAVGRGIKTGFSFIGTVISDSLRFSRDLMATSWEEKMQIVVIATNGILKTMFTFGKELLANLLKSLVNVVIAFQNMFTKIFDMFSNIDWSGVWSGFMDTTKDMLSRSWDSIKNWASSVWESVKNIWKGGDATAPEIDLNTAIKSGMLAGEETAKSFAEQLKNGMLDINFDETLAVASGAMSEIAGIVSNSKANSMVQATTTPTVDTNSINEAIGSLGSEIPTSGFATPETAELTNEKSKAMKEYYGTAESGLNAVATASSNTTATQVENLNIQKESLKNTSNAHRSMVNAISTGNDILVDNIEKTVTQAVALYEKLKQTLLQIKAITAPKEGKDNRTLADVGRGFGITDPTSNGVFTPIERPSAQNSSPRIFRDSARRESTSYNITINGGNNSERKSARTLVREVQLQSQYI